MSKEELIRQLLKSNLTPEQIYQLAKQESRSFKLEEARKNLIKALAEYISFFTDHRDDNAVETKARENLNTLEKTLFLCPNPNLDILIKNFCTKVITDPRSYT